MTSSALRGTSLCDSVALGCLHPDLGSPFDPTTFLPAENNVVLSLFVFLLYFLPLGIAVMAAGSQRAWTVCSRPGRRRLVLIPILVPWFSSEWATALAFAWPQR
jgi:hypothetical protein